MVFDINLIILPLAFGLDMLMGDPRWLPHPIVWMGNAISGCEKIFRSWIKNEFKAGLLFALFLIITTWVIAFFVVKLCFALHYNLGICIQIILLYYCFSARTLDKEATLVGKALETGGIKAGRKQVAMIVGREVDTLDDTGVVSAAVETVAENYVDGFLSPLFFYFLGGVPLALAYKMVNTLDSMVGYKNERYLYFGRAAARIDDAANYIPARLSVIFICLAAALISWHRGKRGFLTALKEGRSHKSPNAGYPEASFAGVLAVKLGGPNYYHGTLVEKPFIGTAFVRPGIDKIAMACDLMLMASFLAMLVFWLGRFMGGVY
ncbi:adenosylcobinamide-phosphate synthase [Desulfocicer vacuolatum DSM 3385]|uniref:Cobalamin biosynthesis protein CobD n=1 Tax=Desulfocicer vacuolatum DSM 3385 TaxID=1121400 RepID=A0A1W2CKJ1_9BACT|nr:adenosylcobinamide-phosphate synthase CbiB [Desulfocicer vacuolatum]SMC85494.1 adenosylcobinamide-phosphate synthase [Desulfocicer vacuolatum DSM 3385]